MINNNNNNNMINNNNNTNTNNKLLNVHNLLSYTTPNIISSSNYALCDMWSFFDEPFGIEVPLYKDNHEIYGFYVPYLSGIKLHKKNNKDIFTWFEHKRPDLRSPLIDQIRRLAHTCEDILCGKSEELIKETSWFAVTYYPILYNISTSKDLSGCFLVYYGFDINQLCPLAHKSIDDINIDEHANLKCINEHDESIQDIDAFLNVKGMISYKVKTTIWDTSALNILRNDAVNMIDKQQIEHPDFNHMNFRK